MRKKQSFQKPELESKLQQENLFLSGEAIERTVESVLLPSVWDKINW